MDFYLVIVVICLGLSFLFSAAETALTSLGRLEVERLIALGGRDARAIQHWTRDPNRMLIIVLIGNNIATIVSSSIFTLWASEKFPMLVSVLMGLLTFIIIIFAEIVPKMIARQYNLATAPTAARFLIFVGTLLSPIIYSVQKFTTRIVLGSGMPGRNIRKPLSEEELSHTIEIAAQEGGIDRETSEVLTNLIDFPDLRARDVMSPRHQIQAISIAWTQEEVARFIAADGHSRYPVYRNSLDELVGILLVKDFLNHIYKVSPGNWTRAVRRCYFVSEMATAGRILKDMRKWGTHMALVRSEMGILTGVITLEDLIEEIVGEIHDEHDDLGASAIMETTDGSRLVRGDITIVDFNDRFNKKLPMDVDYSSLNGYLLKRTGGQIPPVNTLVFDDEVTFRVESVSENGVMTVELIDQPN